MKTEFVGKITEEKHEDVIDLKRFSKWHRLIRTTAWILRFLKIMRRKTENGEELAKQKKLGVEEIEEVKSTG
ncbi:hypothetical protein JTB14_030316 [Gonioctena quinquepunctata]|nr:hypothetical protein JTB14_030316 [Gonioctena quinquepunctata]